MMDSKLLNIPQNITAFKTTFKKGEIIYSLDDQGKYVHILTSGKAICQIDHVDGSFIPLCIYEAYSLFGEVEIFCDNRQLAHIESLSNCITYKIDKVSFLNWLKQDFDLSVFIFKQLSEKLVGQSKQTSDFVSLSLKDRVLKIIGSYEQNGYIDKLTKEKLCCCSAAPLRSVNRVIHTLIEEGKITYKNKQFCLILEHTEKHL